MCSGLGLHAPRHGQITPHVRQMAVSLNRLSGVRARDCAPFPPIQGCPGNILLRWMLFENDLHFAGGFVSDRIPREASRAGEPGETHGDSPEIFNVRRPAGNQERFASLPRPGSCVSQRWHNRSPIPPRTLADRGATAFGSRVGQTESPRVRPFPVSCRR